MHSPEFVLDKEMHKISGILWYELITRRPDLVLINKTNKKKKELVILWVLPLSSER